MYHKTYFVRLVKMEFHPEKVVTFQANFDLAKAKIRQSKGCLLLELYQDKSNSNIFFTHSYWESETDLNNYRKSDLFKNIWAKTKPLFNKKPQVWSLNKTHSE